MVGGPAGDWTGGVPGTEPERRGRGAQQRGCGPQGAGGGETRGKRGSAGSSRSEGVDKETKRVWDWSARWERAQPGTQGSSPPRSLAGPISLRPLVLENPLRGPDGLGPALGGGNCEESPGEMGGVAESLAASHCAGPSRRGRGLLAVQGNR